MTSRERLMAVARGEVVDRKPIILLDGGPESDAAILELPSDFTDHPQKIMLREVLNPLGRATRLGINLNTLLQDDPDAGSKKLDRICQEVRSEIDAAAHSGADGICYRLVGAEPSHSTPMQYGGFYLERDRELLEYAAGASFNLLWIDAGEEAYLDFVSDLEADAFAWDIDRTDVSVAQMRALRSGALAAEDPTADILFARTFADVEAWVSKERTHA